ncbi:S4 domain-containing protein [Geoglobus acetivorans]|uniref:RNA binding methyltransferase FtsJ like n=1 Tax=Geoglobus acetivorans TaxID=565033 RepID=A0A0A7GEY3_GEOAI|nr:RNA binding methyltransferase FtsJ like [Geoglobus acetivorans]
MRIDVWLFRNGYFESRSRAKLAVKKGLVLVDGRVVKPSYDVRGDERIEVLEEGKPAGYFKLREIDRQWNLFEGVKVVLDLGSSAGGFLMYASERAGTVIGIEFSREFEEALRNVGRERKNIRVFIADAFSFDISLLPEIDLILCDLTLEPDSSLKALSRFLPKLRKGGRILFVSKGKEAKFDGFRVLRVMRAEEKREWYYLLEVV